MEQRRPLRGTCFATDDDDDPVIRLLFGKLKEVVAVAGNQEEIIVIGELEH